MIGYAAHATTPFLDEVVGRAIEDACVLQGLLGNLHRKQDRPTHSQRTIESAAPKASASSRLVVVGYLHTMQLDGVKDDLDKLKDSYEAGYHWIWHRNILA